MTCELAKSDAAYVLGALSPAERQEFEQHLPDCPGCARAVQELAGLPGLLGRVDVDLLENPPADDPVPDTLLPRLVREVRRTERRRTRWVFGAAAAAVVAVVAGTVATTEVLQGGPPAPRTVAVGRSMATLAPAPMSARLALQSVAWGTRLDLTCTYAPAGRYAAPTTYTLVVRTRDGGTQQVATWQGLPGRTMRLAAASAASRQDIASVEIRTADGHPLLRLTT